MKPIKSGCTYFRKALKIKGRTTHSGRGFYMMDYDISKQELKRRIMAMIKKNPERYGVAVSLDGIAVKLDPKLMEEEYYYTLYLSKNGSLTVGM